MAAAASSSRWGRLPGSLSLLGGATAVLWTCTAHVPKHHVGVRYNRLSDAPETTCKPGLYFKSPFEVIVPMPAKIVKREFTLCSRSSDGVPLEVDITVFASPNRQCLPELCKRFGVGYMDALLGGLVPEALDEVSGERHAKEVLRGRDTFRQNLHSALFHRAALAHLHVVRTLVRDVRRGGV